jgi:flagellar hook protein FlgE
MSLIGALNTSSLAMLSQSQGMQTVSTNIANVNTTAYKREDTLFQTLLYAQRGNAIASERVAVKPVDRREVMGQGYILATGRADDLAVNGTGFFMVTSSFNQATGKSETMFTRDGSLTQKYVDTGNGVQESFYQAGSGQYLLGWKANDDGTFSTDPTGAGLVPVRSNSLDEIDGTATTEALLAGNVDARTAIGGNASLQGTVYDQSWTAQSLNYVWTKTGANNWSLDFQVSGGTVDTPIAGGTPVVFNGNGQLQTPSTVAVGVTWDDGTSSTVNIDLTEMQQYADTTQVRRTTQNGNESGRLYDESFDKNGVLWGSYTNGRNRPLYKLGMANFVAPNSLEAVSGNLFRATEEAGKMTVKDLETDGNGTSIEVGSLESSNVDMADEFTKMMIVQKAYSMASTNFRTVDEMMELTASLKR